MANTYTNSNSTASPMSAPLSDDTNASLQNVKEDLRTLKTDVVGLGRQATEEGKKRLNDTVSVAQDKVSEFKEAGYEELKGLKSYVSENPTQAVAYAFAAGLIASFVFGRR
ncbi:MAG: hypothetical protein JWO78_1505 [Micavibrio sp.]|nr:hypothetical protein [Micavibrio sp.]